MAEEPAPASADAFAERILGDVNASVGVLLINLGHKLKLYDSVKALGGSCTPVDLAGAAGISPRYADEWLRAMACHGYASTDGTSGTYSMSDGALAALTEPLNPAYVAAFTSWTPALASALPALTTAYKTGGGVPYEAYGDDCLEAISGGNAPMHHHDLPTWLRLLPNHAKLLEGGHVADVGMGVGNSTVSMCKALPKAHLHAIEPDAASVERARNNFEAHGVTDRITIHQAMAHETAITASCELVTMFEMLHDTHNPVEVLKSCKTLLAPGGVVMVGDERVCDDLKDMLPKVPGAPAPLPSFSADDANFLGRFNYGFSALHCLPQAMVYDGCKAPGTCMSHRDLKAFATEAGFSSCEIMTANDFWNVYLLRV